MAYSVEYVTKYVVPRHFILDLLLIIYASLPLHGHVPTV